MSNVRVLPVLGAPCRDSEVIDNAVLLETRLPPCFNPSSPRATLPFPTTAVSPSLCTSFCVSPHLRGPPAAMGEMHRSYLEDASAAPAASLHCDSDPENITPSYPSASSPPAASSYIDAARPCSLSTSETLAALPITRSPTSTPPALISETLLGLAPVTHCHRLPQHTPCYSSSHAISCSSTTNSPSSCSSCSSHSSPSSTPPSPPTRHSATPPYKHPASRSSGVLHPASTPSSSRPNSLQQSHPAKASRSPPTPSSPRPDASTMFATSTASTMRAKLENNGATSLEEEQRGGEHRSPAPKAGARDWAALSRPVSVALFECSLQMETRDPFEPDPESGLWVDFSCGEYEYRIVDDHWSGALSLSLCGATTSRFAGRKDAHRYHL